MYSATIDRNILNDLFDNQKKLDELFDSIFDDENYFVSSSPSSSQSGSRQSAYESEGQFSHGRSKVKETFLAISQRNPYSFVLPIVLEIAAIYFVVTNLL